MQFVPRDLHAEAIPCRFVPLTADGITVDSLYRYGTPAETEDALRSWLRQRIQEIEADQLDARSASRILNVVGNDLFRYFRL